MFRAPTVDDYSRSRRGVRRYAFLFTIQRYLHVSNDILQIFRLLFFSLALPLRGAARPVRVMLLLSRHCSFPHIIFAATPRHSYSARLPTAATTTATVRHARFDFTCRLQERREEPLPLLRDVCC